jgi:transposase
MDKHTTVAVDVAKSVFEVAVSQEPGRVSERRRLTRSQMKTFFVNRPACTVVMEACGTAHYWGRVLQKQEQRVVLLPPAQVRGYRLRDKTDRRDCDALLEAYRNEQIIAVPLKSEHQQSVAAIHRLRSAWMATRTARLNAIRGILREMGVTIPVGAEKVLPQVSALMQKGALPTPLQSLLKRVAAEIIALEREIATCNGQLKEAVRTLPGAERLQSVPGIGVLTATGLVASIGQPGRFRSGRRMAAFIGLVPREHSSGNRRHLGSITKRGDPYLRTLLTHGARSFLVAAARAKSRDPLQQWALAVQERRGRNRAAIAVANKLARIAWAVWSHDVPYGYKTAEKTC